MNIRVLVADDFPLVRDAIVAALTSDPDIGVVGEAADGEEALTLARELRPDVVLLDLKMPGLGGLTVLERLREELPETRVLVVTASEQGERLLDAAAAGAAGYVTKRVNARELLDAVITVHGGGSVVEPAMAGHLLSEHARARCNGMPVTPLFSTREIEILRCVAQGLTDEEIGRELYISPRTVQSHLVHIRGKTGLRRRPQLARWAAEHAIAPSMHRVAA